MRNNGTGKRGQHRSVILEQVSDQWQANEKPKPVPLTKRERRRRWLKGVLASCLVLPVMITVVIPILLGVTMILTSRTAEEGNDAAVGIAVGGGLLVVGLYAAAVIALCVCLGRFLRHLLRKRAERIYGEEEV